MATVIKTLKDGAGDEVAPRTLAKAVTYDNSTSSLTAIDLNSAIDELDAKSGGLAGGLNWGDLKGL